MPPAAKNLFLKKKVRETEGFSWIFQKDFRLRVLDYGFEPKIGLPPLIIYKCSALPEEKSFERLKFVQFLRQILP